MNTRKSTHNIDRELRAVQAALLLAQGYSQSEIVRKLGLRWKTLAAWLADDNFGVAVERLRRTMTPLDTDVLKSEAIEALRESLRSGVPAAVARAATTLLDRVERAEKLKAITNPPPIRVEYINPTGKPYTAPFWTERNPVGGGETESD